MSLMARISRFFSADTAPSGPVPHDVSPPAGPISARQIALVQETWGQVQPIAEQAASLFYSRLFELDPSLKALFTTDMEMQGRKLMQMITTAVHGLSHLDRIVPAVQQLGVRHAQYGVKDEHYATVAVALLWTLEQGLGEAFTPEVKTAWATTYNLLATTMKEAAATVS